MNIRVDIIDLDTPRHDCLCTHIMRDIDPNLHFSGIHVHELVDGDDIKWICLAIHGSHDSGV
jgi:hypothetical protein